mmetsp:Transcript_26037/g.44395  ORF Transcript_26037/g.44395 Transcript_26037/m.44395 type:complete len:209 (-) Transcript_26037:888-1514(-)
MVLPLSDQPDAGCYTIGISLFKFSLEVPTLTFALTSLRDAHNRILKKMSLIFITNTNYSLTLNKAISGRCRRLSVGEDRGSLHHWDLCSMPVDVHSILCKINKASNNGEQREGKKRPVCQPGNGNCQNGQCRRHNAGHKASGTTHDISSKTTDERYPVQHNFQRLRNHFEAHVHYDEASKTHKPRDHDIVSLRKQEKVVCCVVAASKE